MNLKPTKIRRLAPSAIMLAFLILAITFVIAQPSQASPGASGSIKGSRVSGRVIDFDSHQPIADAQVFIYDFKNVDLFARTDTDGNYVFDSVPGGTFWIEVVMEGYASSAWDVGSHQVRVIPGRPVTGLQFELHKAAYIRSKVYQADGSTPLAGIWVRTGLLMHNSLETIYGEVSKDDGEIFTDYPVPANMDVYFRASPTKDTLEYMASWYSSQGDQLSSTMAEPLNLAPGVLREVTFTMEKAPTAQVTPTEGGEVTLETSFKTTISFPPEAVAEEAKITIWPDYTYFLPPLVGLPDGFFTSVVNVNGDGIDNFARPYTITIEYRDADVPQGADETELSIYVWQRSGDLTKVPTTVDPDTNTLTATLDHMSSFLVMAPVNGIYLPMTSSPLP